MTLTASSTGAAIPTHRVAGGIDRRIRWIAHGCIGLAVILSGFVRFEPAPYELFLVALIPIWALFGLRISASIAPLIALLVVFNIGGFFSVLTLSELGEIPIYVGVSVFLAASAIFYAAIIRQDPTLLRTIFAFWTTAAAVTAAIGIAGYFELVPGAELFTRYERATGVFEDPNVFAPYLVPPALLLVHRLMTASRLRTLVLTIPLLLLLGAIFLSFSRGGWGTMAFGVLALVAILLIHYPNGTMRLRVIVAALIGITMIVCGLLAILQFPEVAERFAGRAQLVQDYDGARLGRFARHLIGFGLASTHPFGIGPLEFGQRYGEDTHNIWLKALLDYGWLGFAAYFTLIVWTLIAGARIMFRRRSWTIYLQVGWISLLGHTLLGTVIDTDHWRHFYLLLGIVWGAIALEARWSAAVEPDRPLRSANRFGSDIRRSPPVASNLEAT